MLRRLILRAIQVVTGTVLLAVLGLGWYVSTLGFSPYWRERVCAEVRITGFELTMRKLTLDPFRGLVAHGVRILARPAEREPVAEIDRIALDIAFGELLAGRPFLAAADLHRATLALPFPAPHDPGRKLAVTNLNARILSPPGQLHISRAEATVFGVRVNATGALANPDAWRNLLPPGEGQPGPGGDFRSWLDLAQEVVFSGGRPRLNLRVDGDLRVPAAISAELEMTVPGVQWRQLQLSDVTAAATLRQGEVTLRALAGRDRRGKFELRGGFDLATRTAQFEGQSTLDPAPFLALPAARPLKEVIFYDPPLLEFSGGADFRRQSFTALGQLTQGRFGVRSVVFDGLAVGFSWRDGSWYLADGELRHGTGTVKFGARQMPDDFRANIAVAIDPAVFLPLLPGKAATMLGEWKFIDRPSARLTVRGAAPTPEACKIEGELTLGRSLFRGQAVKKVTSAVAAANGAVTYRGFRLERDEGVATGTFTYDFAGKEVRVSDVKAAVNPAEVAVWIDPKMVKDVAPYRFRGPPALTVDGRVDLVGGRNTDLRVGVVAPRGMDFTFAGRDLFFGAGTAAQLHLKGSTLYLREAEAELFGGRVRGESEISVDPKNPVYTSRLTADNVNFASLTRLYFNYEESRGRLAGSYQFSGSGPDPRAMRGAGSAEVIEGNVFAIPILGPLSGILNTIIPGLGYNVARKASATFRVAAGTITSDDFVVVGQGFSMIGGGNLLFLDDRMDFTIRINARGLPGTILFPVSKLFEYRAECPMSKPAWKPKRLPSF